MITLTKYSSPDGHVYLRCDNCGLEFYIVPAKFFVKQVAFCPYCGMASDFQKVDNNKETTNK